MRRTFPVHTSKEALLREKVAFECGTQERMETQTERTKRETTMERLRWRDPRLKKTEKTMCMVQTKRGKLTIILDLHCQHCLESSPTLSLESRLEIRLRL